jgi:hypothetical protein
LLHPEETIVPLYRCLRSSMVGARLVRKGEFIDSCAEELGVMAEHFTLATVAQDPERDPVVPVPMEPEPTAAGIVPPVRRSRKVG